MIIGKHHTGCRYRVFIYGRPATGAISAHPSFNMSVLQGESTKMAESFCLFFHENHFPIGNTEVLKKAIHCRGQPVGRGSRVRRAEIACPVIMCRINQSSKSPSGLSLLSIRAAFLMISSGVHADGSSMRWALGPGSKLLVFRIVSMARLAVS
jgi:hypothetical protein